MALVNRHAHTVKQFDIQLANLRNSVLEMGELIEAQIQAAIAALANKDMLAAREVIARDKTINAMQVKIDEYTISLIALRQPLGSDLRLVISLSKIATDLERAGDEAKKIARMATKIYESAANPPNLALLKDVQPMSKLALTMLRGSLDALASASVAKAVEVAKNDAELNQEFKDASRRLITCMTEDQDSISHAINVLFIVKALERIGDHSKNVSEYIIYLAKGKDVRHVGIDALLHDAFN